MSKKISLFTQTVSSRSSTVLVFATVCVDSSFIYLVTSQCLGSMAIWRESMSIVHIKLVVIVFLVWCTSLILIQNIQSNLPMILLITYFFLSF